MRIVVDLPRPVRPEEADDLPLGHLEADVVDGHVRAVSPWSTGNADHDGARVGDGIYRAAAHPGRPGGRTVLRGSAGAVKRRLAVTRAARPTVTAGPHVGREMPQRLRRRSGRRNMRPQRTKGPKEDAKKIPTRRSAVDRRWPALCLPLCLRAFVVAFAAIEGPSPPSLDRKLKR